MNIAWPTALAIAALIAAGCADGPRHHDPAHAMSPTANVEADARELVPFPAPMRQHTLANMRDHLRTLGDINAALSQGDFDAASTLAEQRLGMTSMDAHGAAHLAPFMPQGMQQIGSDMHRAASRFATAAQDAAATNDPRPALAALAAVTQQCVACHAAYRLQ